MRVVVQRVSKAKVMVGSETTGEVGPGMLLLVGVGRDDNEDTCRRMSAKVARLRIFDDAAGKMNLSLLDTHGQALVVSQFTLYADTSRGLRPSFTNAGEPARANELYERFVSELSYLGVPTRTGRFGARMSVELVNDGPVTFVLEDNECGVRGFEGPRVQARAVRQGPLRPTPEPQSPGTPSERSAASG